MHSIERYGIVALLFLIVTVVAVLMWDGGKAEEPEKSPVKPAAAKTLPDAERERLATLIAEGRPGPLQRKRLDEEAPADAPLGADERAEALRASEPPAEVPDALHAPEAEAESQTLREQLVQDDYIATAPQATPERAKEAPATRSYAVRAGDTLSEIAQRELGSSRRWQEIVAANPGLDPAKLRSGTTIRLPSAARAGANGAAGASANGAAGADASGAGGTGPRTAAVPAQEPKTPAKDASSASWTVGKNENLWRIAERALGDGKRWGEIAKLNPSVNPDKLLLGQVLKLPSSSKGSKGAKDAKAGGSSGKSATDSGTRVAREASAPVVAVNDRPRRGGKVK